ncbi:MAG TPA: TolC family protein, partial [Polyangiaceae bacterium]|nr:TolC family protein [Polyangiaceae bacterium]
MLSASHVFAQSAAGPPPTTPPLPGPASPKASPPGVQGGLSLENAVQLALTRNERARIADLNVDVAKAGVERARAAFLPVLGVNGSESWKPKPEDRAGTSSSSSSSSSSTNTGTATASITQPLLNASAFPLYAQAKNTLAGQRAQTEDDKRQLAFDTAKTFFSVLSTEELLQAALRRLESAKLNLADTQARVSAQLVSSNDATRAQIDMASAGREVETDKGLVQNAYLDLAFIVNAPVPGSVAPPESLLTVAQQPAKATDDLVKFALAHRPDVSARKFSAAAAHDSADEPLLRLIPSIGLTGQAQGSTNTLGSGRWHDETLSVTGTW